MLPGVLTASILTKTSYSWTKSSLNNARGSSRKAPLGFRFQFFQTSVEQPEVSRTTKTSSCSSLSFNSILIGAALLRFLIGLIVGASISTAAAQHYVTCGQGTLKGYIVQDQERNEVCRDPAVWNHFRGPDSYIICDD